MAAVCALVVATTGAAAAAPPDVTTKATFNTGKDEWAIVEHLEKLIEGAWPGSHIYVASMLMDLPRINDKLADAATKRKVVVKVVHEHVSEESNSLKKRLKDAGNGSAVIDCKNDGKDNACIGTRRMHNKFFLFTRTLDATDVVSLGTANMNTESATETYNSWFTEPDAPMFDEYHGYWEDLVKGKKDLDYYHTRKPQQHGNFKTYFYPRSSGDTFENTLEAVDCEKDGGTIRLAHFSITRKAVADQLRRLGAEGCKVEVVATRLQGEACTGLADKKNVRVWGFEKGDRWVHSKNLLIDSTYGGSREWAVFTGSHNLNGYSLTQNDENVLRITDRANTYQQFVANFKEVQKAAVERHLTDCPWTEK
jgi:phosphatidylserine/phosphatidylglycerophosphate/cardiolipin synthase-like enzyme